MRIGVLAIQGDFEAHAKILKSMDVTSIYVTRPEHLSGIQGLILPGGESTTMLKLLMQDGFFDALKKFAMADRFLFGTCAGSILLAKEVLNPSQVSLNLLDATVERNAYGRQLASHIGKGNYFDQVEAMEMIFIRAPKITRVDSRVEIFATYQNEPVGVMNDRCMITTFHPELTNDTTLHQLFLDKIQGKRSASGRSRLGCP
jgi:pyridoxal 5'-phosphate synthase pdxT subunit